MKPLISKIVLSLSLTLLLTACGGGGGGSDSGSGNSGSSTPPQNNQTNGTNNNTNPDNNQTVEIIHGYVLPPYPDPAMNDLTLLGVDSNNNGIRDDVEIWLLREYKDDHRIVAEIALQVGRAHQYMLANPDEWGKYGEAMKKIDAAQDCNFYFEFGAKYRNEPILIDHDIATYKKRFRTIQHNTEARIRAYLSYDKALSGGGYTAPKIDERRAACDFNVDKFLQEYPDYIVKKRPNVISAR